MSNLVSIVKCVAAAAGYALGAAFGPLDGLLIALLVVMLLDYITGVADAVITKTLSSEIGFKGLAKKTLILCAVLLAHTLDGVIGDGSGLRSMVILYYLANEGLSILENLIVAGVPVPGRLRDLLKQIEHDNDSEDV